MKQLQMRYLRSTVRTHIYEEIDDVGEPMFNATVRTLYVNKHAFPDKPTHLELRLGLEGERDD